MTAISVTAEHIAAGQRGDCAFCPVALAVTGAFPRVAYLRVYVHEVVIRGAPETVMAGVTMPLVAQRFIRDFDAGQPVEPFTFELDYPAVTP
jgi:hypothetical protein